jgi:uncharacterized delta-60 repeat protein
MTRIRICTLAVFSNLALAVGLRAAPGFLDTSFAGTGTTRIRFGFGDDYAHAVTVQPDGKVVVAGHTSLTSFTGGGSLALVRYDTNNVPDRSFGNGGKVIASMSSNTNASAAAGAVKVQLDGKIVVTGTLYEDSNEVALLARFNPDGSLDGSFGQNGIVTNSFGFRGQGRALAIQSDGKIVVGGLGATTVFGADFALARFHTNGLLDTSFGGAGIVLDTGGQAANGLAIQSDGRIVAAGLVIGPGHNLDFGAFRYTTAGVLDTTFGLDHTGKVFTHLGTISDTSFTTSVAIEPGDGLQTLDRIVLGGYTEAFNPFRFEVVRYRIDGSLDTTFGGSGVVTVSVGSGLINIATCLQVQGTGIEPRKIILAGYSTSSGSGKADFCAIRFNDNGTLDNSFDGDGKAFTSFGSNLDVAYAATLVPDGKLLVVGSTTSNENDNDFALARYNLSDGSLDNSFDGDGKMAQDVGERESFAKAVAIQPDGKIVVAGNADNGSEHSTAITRFNPDGVMDLSFGRFGRTTLTFGEADSSLNAVTIQPDGKIVAAAFAGTNFLVARYTTNGVLDTSFNGSGTATTTLAANGNIANAVTLQSDGKIVVAGTASFGRDFAVLRYNPTGILDTSFDGDGKLAIDVDVNGNQANAVKLQPDGKIIVAGYSVIGGTAFDITAVRLKTNGAVDSSFGTFGAVATPVGSGRAFGFSLAIQPDGKILIAGATVVGSDFDFALVRYATNGTLDASFADDGKVITAIGLGTDVGTAIDLQSDGKIIVAGYATVVGRPEFVAVRYHANGALDTSYGVGGKAFVDFDDRANNTANALALDSAGRALIAGDAGGFFGVARLQADPHLQILSITRLPNGHTLLTGVGVPNQSHTMQGATHLISGGFGALGPVTADGAGLWQYDDAGAVNLPSRFYRLVFP